MKRWIVKAGATSLDQLIVEEVAKPEPGPGEVRVKVCAVSLNRRDELLLTGTFGVSASDFDPISHGAGDVDALGSGVGDFALGDRFVGNYFPSWADGPPASGQGWGLGSPGQDGMLTEYAILRADRLTRVPNTLSLEEAACLPCAALTAWTALKGDRPYRHSLVLSLLRRPETTRRSIESRHWVPRRSSITKMCQIGARSRQRSLVDLTTSLTL